MKAKRIIFPIIIIVSVGLACSGNCFAMRLLTKEEALKQMFPDAQSISITKRTLTREEIDKVKGRLGGQLVHYQEGSKSAKVDEKLEYEFYFSMVNGVKTGVAIMEEQPGKWGPVEFCIALDPGTAKIKNLAVMSYEEKRGRPIARNNFLSQFFGKGSRDPIQVRKDIRAISGATISSDCTCFAVRKAIVLYQELFMDGNQRPAITQVGR